MDARSAISLLIRAAKEVQSAATRTDLLAWAEELVSGLSATSRNDGGGIEDVAGPIEFPLPITTNVKGQPISGLLHGDGRLEINGKTFMNPSQAASDLLGYRTNGYRVWKYKDGTGHSWTLDALVHKGLIRKGGLRRRRSRS